MRVLQLIDSLSPGGAERMAVSFANALADRVEASFICSTRKEGLLKGTIRENVPYLFLEKTSTLDIKAFRTLSRFVKDHKITVLHAHSSSFFLATLIKIRYPKLHLVWHDHYGESEHLAARKFFMLKKCSRYFNTIISVNTTLKKWAEENLKCTKVYMLSNFVNSDGGKDSSDLKLPGKKGLRLVCLANFRKQKDHLTLLRAFQRVLHRFPEATLHLIGKEVDEAYSEQIKAFIVDNAIENVHLHGPQLNVLELLKQADIGVLSSSSEGLPVALLEYGIAGLAVVCTNVGECKIVVGVDGIIVPPNDSTSLSASLIELLEDDEKRKHYANQFHEKVVNTYTFPGILPQLMKAYGEA
ncbi:glycosyltransferase [Luteirhabdus pelagi]|uniref:glycosyltransferase n=1 Tax=Luteirhabdus pelagi TaxID=2792783 RepID=UPI00193A67CF|nr:glycosyltransferase [Luteirhabdus pelagi]